MPLGGGAKGASLRVIPIGSHSQTLVSAWLAVGAALRRDGRENRGIKPLLQKTPELAPGMGYADTDS
jgi:hypothetical protein